MIRQLLSLLLITALLGNQAVVCCGHAHERSSDHTSRAHIHMGGHSHNHGAGHHHHHGHQHDDSDHQHFPERTDPPGLSPANSVDHDSDAVYFAEDQQVLLAPGDISLKKSSAAVTIPEPLMYGYPDSQILSLECTGPHSAFAHALYLQTSRLLL